MRIALDAMGGDLAPKVTVEGAVLAARDFGAEVILVGVRETLERELAAHDVTGLPIRIVHAPEVVTMDDSPLESVLGKPLSSIHIGLEMVKRGEAHSFVSAGNSGAVMAAAMAILGNLPRVDRPAIASPAPAAGAHTLLIDAGANLEVKPLNLAQFAVMGSVYCRRVRGIARPRVGILSNGEESSKGTDLTRAAAAMLRQASTDINYIGYVEGRDINRGKADVVVTDGFTGNVALKTMEGFAAFLLGNLREVFGANWRGKLAYLLVRKSLGAIRERLDPYEYGGAPLLGVNGVTIIAHGSSPARAIRNAIRAAGNEALVRQVNSEISEILGKYEFAASSKQGGKGFKGIFARMRERLHRHNPREVEGHAAAGRGRSGGTGELPHARPEHEARHDPSRVEAFSDASEASRGNGVKPEASAAPHKPGSGPATGSLLNHKETSEAQTDAAPGNERSAQAKPAEDKHS